MSGITKILVSSLLIVHSLRSQEITMQDFYELVIPDNIVEEIYPVDDLETIFTLPDIDDVVLDIELNVPTVPESNIAINLDIVPAQVIEIVNDCGLILMHDCQQDNHESLAIEEDEDLIPVPHELINSVKKEIKKRKKLEKKERKSFFKAIKFNK